MGMVAAGGELRAGMGEGSRVVAGSWKAESQLETKRLILILGDIHRRKAGKGKGDSDQAKEKRNKIKI